MISDVQAAVANILDGVPTLENANGAGRIFELFVMTGVATRLKNRSFDVWLQRSDGTRVGPADTDRRFFQRGGAPTGVARAAAGPGNASVIGFRRLPNGRAWEMWNGIQFEGRSGALHEIDIAVVPGEVGIELRLTGGYPIGRPRVAIECKDVGSAGSIDEMRAFVARLYDLTILLSHQKYLGFSPSGQAIYPGDFAGHPFYSARFVYWEENRRTFDAIARRAGFAAGAAAMTDYYDIEPHGFIRKGTSQASSLMDGIADWIDSRFP
jgi:hypothetical protein